MNSKKGEMDTAKTNISNLAYYEKVNAQTLAKTNYDAAEAKNTALTEKIARVEKILKHMKDGDKGTIPELNAKKQTKDAEISGLGGLEKKIENLTTELKGYTDKVTSTKKAMDDAKGLWDKEKATADKALLDIKTPLEAVKVLRDKVTSTDGEWVKAKGAVAIKDKEINV